MRPSSVVRRQRNCCWLTRLVFQRGRGRRNFRSSVNDRKHNMSSFSACNNAAASTRYWRNILSVERMCCPFNQTSASVAKPSKQSWPACSGDLNVVRYHQSCSSMAGGCCMSHRPMSRSADATVPGTGAAIQSTAATRNAAASVIAPAGVAQHVHEPKTEIELMSVGRAAVVASLMVYARLARSAKCSLRCVMASFQRAAMVSRGVRSSGFLRAMARAR